ncbi:hypothetical protein BDU57DRAFT_328015 [Ampelomyces quisqualis]|uniref:DUF6535 domain-containing protein n=1 Tax=Ampelomyces quisqualis TaxID=50730 RepID=A0A6A5QEY5_AMPQU|nr:hypothetical protein BDU57DRAFT_328015 [Ampelomyces quisqualis]
MTDQSDARELDIKRLQEQSSFIFSLSKFLLAVLTLPYRRAFRLYTWKPLRNIRLARGDCKLLIPLVKEWKADKYTELQSVQVAATFCGAAVFSSLPLSRSEHAVWASEALWFIALVCSIFAIITSIQTKSMLDDLPSREQLSGPLPDIELQRMQRAILRFKKTPGLRHWIMVFIWQFPSMTMAYAWCTYLAGLTVYICSPFLRKLPWQDRHKIALAYLSFGLVGLVTYVSATIFVYAGEKDYERSVASSRASTLGNARVDAADLEAAVPANQTGSHAEAKKNSTNSTIADEIAPVQAARARLIVRLEDPRAARNEESQSRRSLLY